MEGSRNDEVMKADDSSKSFTSYPLWTLLSASWVSHRYFPLLFSGPAVRAGVSLCSLWCTITHSLVYHYSQFGVGCKRLFGAPQKVRDGCAHTGGSGGRVGTGSS